MTAEDTLNEILAIKLFEHGTRSGKAPKTPNMGWTLLCNEDREIFRNMARNNNKKEQK